MFTVKDLTDSKYAQSRTLMTILMFYVCVLLYAQDNFFEEDDTVLDEWATLHWDEFAPTSIIMWFDFDV